MKSMLKIGAKNKGLLHLDPRTILLLLVMGNLAVFIMPSVKGEILLTVMILILGLLCGVYGFSFKLALIYFAFLGIDYICMTVFNSHLSNYIALFVRFIRKVLPCGMLGGILIGTTRVNEFMAALSRMNIPKSVLIPLTVMLRYFPAIGEDTKKIKNAMKMRNVTPGFLGFIKNPARTIECIYVPIMMSASRRADELSAASVSRGIENPLKRTSIQEIRFRTVDAICVLAALLYLIFIWRI